MAGDYSRRRYVGSIGAAVVGVALAGCGGDGGDGGGGGGTTVEMAAVAYEPASITVDVGEAVTWENTSTAGHTVTAYEGEIPDGAAYFASGGFDSEQAAREAYTVGDSASGDVAPGGTYEHTFGTEGTYGYFCVPHESAGMVGTVDVREA